MTEAPSSTDLLPGDYAFATSAGLVSVIVPNYDGAHFLGPCLRSLFAQGFADEELDVLVIDNGSRDGSMELVRREFPSVLVIANTQNIGFTRATNQGLAAARGEWILLLNNDTIMDSGALRILLDQLRQSGEEIGGVQPLLLRAGDGTTVDSAGIVLGERFGAHDYLHGQPGERVPRDVTEVWGLCFACALLRSEVVKRAGPLDSDFFAEWDDVDFATRARWLGYMFQLVPAAKVLHHRSPTSDRDSRGKFSRLRRNRVLTFVKCLPRRTAARLVLYRVQHDVGMIFHFLRRGEFGTVARAWWEVLRLTPRMLSRRREWKRQARLSDRQMRIAIEKATVHD
jgi:hypothetical protein